MEGSTVSSYSVFATSTFDKHSAGLSALAIATNIIGAIIKPFIAKLGDITSRPMMFSVILAFWTIGFIIAAASSTVSAYIVGSTFISIGSNGLDLMSDIICGDLVPLEWRGFMSSLLAFPYFITTWFTGLIVDAMATGELWRWGYGESTPLMLSIQADFWVGMWAIIMPVVLTPAIALLFYLERLAQKHGVVNIASSKQDRRNAEAAAEETGEKFERGRGVNAAAERKALWPQIKTGLIEIDAFGLILLGFGWVLFLLPFSLRSSADGGWKNPSLIASECCTSYLLGPSLLGPPSVFIVGGLILIAYVVYERFWAPFPTMPARIFKNKTFIMAVIIDTVYTLAGGMRSTYFSSYVWIVTDINTRDWTYLLK